MVGAVWDNSMLPSYIYLFGLVSERFCTLCITRYFASHNIYGYGDCIRCILSSNSIKDGCE